MDRAAVEIFLRTTVAELAVKVMAAVVFWFVGRWLIGRVIHLVQATMHRNQIDPTFTRYLGSIITVAQIPNVLAQPAPEMSLLAGDSSQC